MSKRLKSILISVGLCISILVVSIIFDEMIFATCASLFCVIYLTLLAENIKSAYILGMIYAVFYSLACMKDKLYASFIFTVLLFLPIMIYSFFTFNKRKETHNKLSVKKWCFVSGAIVISFVLFVIVFYFLKDAQPIVDSLALSISIVAILLLLGNYVELWIFNILGAILNFTLWIIQFLTTGNGASLLILYLFMIGNGVYGIYCWIKSVKKVSKKTDCLEVNSPEKQSN